ncbi:myelin-associated glycoprotein-like isoform X1 [Toxotes jaculatrix]|uniref:myelin-associated glycoprotein-like isoform X1 n=1 Tax=Toxotes jaculatrix TaxID=941984 RepID=UPI001B3B1211|nr:myelin-associated glycoprotein-like isoform X1 [Toxotes jaculatrix]XP_040899773.1 myelin-associated glycoprotein-like isoform X1 [Toxotes jaculatrix]
MDALKWPLFFLWFCVKVVHQTEGSSWTINLPSSVKGLPGYCVVIPCSFNYPDLERNITKYTGIWMEQTSHAIYHPVESEILQDYRSRTELLGDVTQKNCSLKIDPLKQSDQGPFFFRIDLENYDKFSYKEKTVTITMISKLEIDISMQEEVVEGQTVQASCSVSPICPTSPPVFSWSHSGKQHSHSQQLGDGQWVSTATLTFHPTRPDHNKPLLCTVRYKGGQQEISKVLKVNYAPEIQDVSSCSLHGDVVKCMCFVTSWPPSMVYFVLSDKVLPVTTIKGHGTVTIGTVQVDFGSSEFVRCLANNTVGNASISLSLPVNGKMQNLYIAVGAGVGLVILLITVGFVIKCRRTPGNTATPHMSAMEATKAEERSQCATMKRKQMDCDDEKYQYHTTDHIYGNMETDLDDAIYANM